MVIDLGKKLAEASLTCTTLRRETNVGSFAQARIISWKTSDDGDIHALP